MTMSVSSAEVLDVRRLQMLSELQRLGTIAAVANELHLSAPAVSMQLGALEREVGLALTERQGRRVVLTPAGAVLAAHGHDIVDLVSVAEMEVQTLRQGESGTYRIAAFPSAARSYVTDTWERLRDGPHAGPALRLTELEPDAATEALVRGDLDLAVTHAYSNVAGLPSQGLSATPLSTEEVLLATAASTAPPTTRSGAARLADLAHSDWVIPHAELACAEMVKRACGAAGFRPGVVAEATDHAVQLQLVAAGIGVALVPRSAVQGLPHGVRLLPVHPRVERHHFALTRRSARSDPGLRRILELLKDNATRRLGEPPAAVAPPSATAAT
jgi:DNA-binding transcriptional LysR family regulator